MKNKNVGYLIIGMAVMIVVIILIFNLGLKNIVSQTCSHGSSCTMYDTISVQTYFSLAIAGLVLVVGLFLIFSKPDERVIVKKIKEKKLKKKIDLSGFRSDEKEVFKLIQDEGTIFQANLIERTGFGKGKMTRILDKLDGKDLIDRKRRGLTNVVVLKNL